MGVIGRLDQQVDELIIRPLGERAGNESQAPPKTVKQLPPAGEQENQREDEDKSDRRSQDLPVWLL